MNGNKISQIGDGAEQICNDQWQISILTKSTRKLKNQYNKEVYKKTELGQKGSHNKKHWIYKITIHTETFKQV